MPLGKWLIVSGLILVAVGVALTFAPKLPWLGRLPGDILIQRERFTFSFPLTTCLILSLLLTLVANLFFHR
ncbi:MAG: DUF2905 domain-containing protein [Candidatus Omnitrophica bacterium]|nr:DUF2905 domain-containing protein [Candidatus Omnitrophota bacterium]